MQNKNDNCHRTKQRSEEEKKNLDRRLKIIAGQINGISQMVDDDRYCDDILLQIVSVTNALKSLGNEMLKSHMKTCIVEDIQAGDLSTIDEVFNLLGKLK